MASGEIQRDESGPTKYKDDLQYVEDIPIGGGIDSLSAPTKLIPGTHSEVKNLLLDKKGAYRSRNPYTLFAVDVDEIYVDAAIDYFTTGNNGEFVIDIDFPDNTGSQIDTRITHLFHYKRHDGKECYIVVADNNADDSDDDNTYICAVFKVNIDGTNSVNISKDQAGSESGAQAERRFYTGKQEDWIGAVEIGTDKNGCSKDIYWDCRVVTDMITNRDMIVLTNGATLPQVWSPDNPEVDYTTCEQLRDMGYILGTGSWERPNVAGSTATATASGYLNGKYFYKMLAIDPGGDSHRSPSSVAFPTDGVVCIDDYVALAVLPNLGGDNYEIYRTKGDGRTFYYVTTLDPGVNAYDDKIPDRDLGWEIPNIGDPPDAGYKYVEVYNGHIWLGNRRLTTAGALSADTTARWAERIIYSDVGYPESFRKDYSDLQIVGQASSGKYDPIIGFWSNEDYLMTLKQDSTWILQGYDPAGYSKFDISCIDIARGCSSHRTIITNADGKPEWLWQKEWLTFDGLRVRRILRLAERTLNKISLVNLARSCAVYYPHAGYTMLAYTKHKGTNEDLTSAVPAFTPEWNNRMIGYYNEMQHFVNFETLGTDLTGQSIGVENKTFTAMAIVENDTHQMEKVMLGESDPLVGGYLYRWDQPQATSNLNKDVPGTTGSDGVPASRNVVIRKELKTDWLDQNRPWQKKKSNFLVLTCKTNNDEVDDATGGPRASFKMQAFLEGKENPLVPAWPMDSGKTDYPYKLVKPILFDTDEDPDFAFEYTTMIIPLADASELMVGNMSKYKILHELQGFTFEIIKLQHLFTPVRRVDRELYYVTPP